MRRFSVNTAHVVAWRELEEETIEQPDMAQINALIQSFDAARGGRIKLYHHLTPAKMPYEVLLVGACTQSRYRVWYWNTWAEHHWVVLKDVTQHKNYRQVHYMSERGHYPSGEYICFTVSLEKALQSVTYFLEHGTLNLNERWVFLGNTRKYFTKARFKKYQDSL